MASLFDSTEIPINFLKPNTPNKVSDEALYIVDKSFFNDDPTKTYKARLRFLPYILDESGEMAESSVIEKKLHFIKFPKDSEHANLNGYYECGRNFKHIDGGKCELCAAYSALDKRKDEMSKVIGWSPRFYSYVLILEDTQRPELVGKIKILPYGKKIKDKIVLEDEDGVKVFDLANGKDFKFNVRLIGDFPNYDTSAFTDAITPITIGGKSVPTIEKNGKNVLAPEFVEKMVKFLLKREKSLSEYTPLPMGDEGKAKVAKILDAVGFSYGTAGNRAEVSVPSPSKKVSVDDYFNDDADEIPSYLDKKPSKPAPAASSMLDDLFS